MSIPTKRSIAVLIRNGNLILSTRRADNDGEFPGVWGLPAGTYRGSETLEELVVRIGRDKLGVTLIPTRKLGGGSQERERYTLDMEIWEAEMSGVPQHPAWKWATPDILQPGSINGSLCCSLALEILRN